MDKKRHITAPLRYGRRSTSREDTYTMVFSPSAVKGDVGTGVGLFVPFARAIESPNELIDEALTLWCVEANKPFSKRGAVSAKWGSVVLQLNPHYDDTQGFGEAWSKLVAGSPDYGSLKTAEHESRVVNRETGLTELPWPSSVADGSLLDADMLLFTATKPTLEKGRCPSPEMVAEAWKRKPNRLEYFCLNRLNGIQTEDDATIEAILKSG